MLAESVNSNLYPIWLAHVADAGTREAFVYLAGYAATLNEMTCHAQSKGEVRDFRFYSSDQEQPFSFIINKKWLLFYFRTPSVRSGKYSPKVLASLFSSMNENKRGEWTVRVSNLQDARRLTEFLALH